MGSQTDTKTFKVRGITCVDCVTHIAESVRRLPGTQKVGGNLTQGTIKVTFEPDRVQPADIVKAIEGAGYSVEAAEA